MAVGAGSRGIANIDVVVGATVRWLDFDPATGELDDLAPAHAERPRLVATPLALAIFVPARPLGAAPAVKPVPAERLAVVPPTAPLKPAKPAEAASEGGSASN